MIEMPPLQFAQVNGIRMGYYEAGPKSDQPPLILCHGWPEIALSLRHPSRVAGVVGVNTPHWDRAPADPIELFRQRFGDKMYIVQFQDPGREPDRIFGSRVEQTFDAFMRKPVARPEGTPEEQPIAGVGASPRLNLAFPQMIANYDARHDPRTPILSP